MIKFRIFFLVTFSLSFIQSFAQISIKGKVVDEKTLPLDYFSVEILTSNDSSFVKRGSFLNGEFQIDNIKEGEYMFKFSSLGYLDLITIDNVQSINNKTFQLTEKSIDLKEIVVISRLPKVLNKTDRYVVEVENTSISDAGNAVNALSRTPFVIVDNMSNEVTIAGKGTTLIMINNRRISGYHELEMLNSQDIKEIEVIENPSAKYEAEGHSVINIITKKKREKGININLQTLYTRGRHDSGKLLGSVTYSIDKLVLFTQYGYNADNSEGFNSSNEKYEKGGYSFIMKQKNLENLDKTRLNEYSLGVNYHPIENHSFAVKYDGYYGNIYFNTINKMDIILNNTAPSTEFLYKGGKNSVQKDGINFNYNFGNKGYEISLISDYIKSKGSSNFNIDETDTKNSYQNHKLYDWLGNYDLYSIQFDAKIPLNSVNASLEGGNRYSYVKSENDSKFFNNTDGNWVVNDEFSSLVNFDEKIFGTYVLLTGKIREKTQYSIGLRYEYSDNKNRWDISNDSFEKNNTSNFFPSLLITHRLKDDISLRLSYSKRISRPSYEALNNSIKYINSYSNEQGNPYLKPAMYNTVSLSSQTKNINTSFHVSYIENPNDLLYLNDLEQIEKYTCMRINTENRWSFTFNLNSSFSYKKWSIQPFFSLTYMERAIIEDGIKYKTDYPGIYLSIRNSLNLYKNLDMDFDATYNKASHSFKKFNDQYIFNLSLRKKLLKDKLTIQLTGNYTPTKWEQKLDYSYKYIDFVWNGDNRKQLTLSVRYNFNTAKKQFKSKSSNTEELRRL
ncbi:MAG: TonB-dependent receptor [Tannerellaceae bacterium]|jgi:hypothetical protein|nr:TonB-dependent receptor [Tannerellaceae bacterium]